MENLKRQLTNIDRAFGNKENILDEDVKFLKERFLNNSMDAIETISVFDTFQWPDKKDV